MIKPDEIWGDSEAKNAETWDDSDIYYSQIKLEMTLGNDTDETMTNNTTR